MRRFAIVLISLFLTACESYPPAPTIERTPTSKPAPPVKSVAKPNTVRDWQPDSYIVKKGDTLFSIALQFGYYYKEIAAANNISEPYPIKIGQKLSFTSLNTKAITADNKPVLVESDDGVVVSPIKTDPAATPSAISTPSVSNVTPLLTEPKAIREPYSLEALNRKAVIAKPSETPPADAKPTDTKQSDNKPTDDESIVWTWPTQGKTIASFDGVSNKGIDIAGAQGQSIVAASNGKVIYVGSDLRGYGKLVIIKHNKTFLSVYAHNSKIVAKEGQLVTTGQKIAEMGNTDANTVKLHFEIRQQGKSVDPSRYLPQN
ncbi:MAG: peptidoglycan DD-metalloendopeptidase family protein [Methylophilaceae bacterium]